MKRTKRLLIRVMLVLASIGVALLIAEAAFRYLRPSYNVGIPASYEYDPELAFKLRPNAHLLRTTDFQQESRVNRLGTFNFQDGFDDYETLVFAVGDSYTQGTGVAADMSYPFQLDLTLNRDEQGFYVKRFGVVNLGVAGYGGEQSLLAVKRHAERLRAPSVILYMGCDNDYEDDLLFLKGYRHGQYLKGDPRWSVSGAPLRWLSQELHIGIKLRRLADSRLRARLRREALGQMGVGDEEPSVAELEISVLERLAAFAREHGSLLVVTWSEEGASYDWLKSWAGQRSILFSDWGTRRRSVRAAIPALPPDNQHSGAHHRGWANRIIAEEFARHIRARHP